MPGPDPKALGLCMDRGHEPIEAVLFESIVKTVKVPFELPAVPGMKRQRRRFLMLCGRCGLAYWEAR